MILFRPTGRKELKLVRDAGGQQHRELWVPAENLADFNSHILGQIIVIAGFRDGSILSEETTNDIVRHL